ncbi:AAA family ATPase [Desulfovibrio oxamicus]|uniref:endopeptidase La n=1 Tax=Nitratidesulfovibrio oxamicus TaxID=32016 RepID=A0ABS0J0Z8_9BACT|nr:ATP-binding protein [Nitratidesulfovibrio oxamicus]MBG3875870.1 AAA family ATPase [Nitratidesulfovibrio oxamicus]
MTKVSPLPAARLRATLDPARIRWETSDAIPRPPRNGMRRTPQPRVLQALELALHIRDGGYNVYLSGEANLGRTYMLREYLAPRARKMDTPPDLVHVYNFEDPDRPRLIALPAGQGRKLRTALTQALSKARKEAPSRFEHDAFVRKRTLLLDKFQTQRSKLFKEMDTVAGGEGFNLDMDDSGSLTLYPIVEGKRLSEDEYEKLDATLRKSLKLKGDRLLQAMTGLMRKLTRAEQDFVEDERTLEKEVVREVLDQFLTPLADKFAKTCPCDELKRYFADMREDILDNIEGFVQRDMPTHMPQQQPDLGPPPEDTSFRYDINVFVDNSETHGAPIVVDDHPTPSNLLGCIERESEMGALVTDFTLVKAGSLQKANGGFLVLHMEDILSYPSAWEGLLRALRSGLARIEDAGDGQESTKTKGIEPEPLRLDLKVVLVGTEEMYETLLVNDDRFPKLFKIKAHLTEATERNADGVKVYLARIARIIDEAKLLPFDRDAMAGLVDYGSRIIEDQRKLSLKFPVLRELMIEASALASMKGSALVDRTTLHDAMVARTYRANLVEQHYMDEYDRELIKVRTSGSEVGRVNGLSVTWYGDFEFGLPHQISCTVGVGHGGIIDLEREAELGGPIHTKAMMILKSYLVSQFARTKPLVMTGSLCFEQSYAGIEGDSASGAELAALLSAIADVPIRLSLAFTGAVSQSGQIMAVGGVTRKVEGFFEVCSRHGLTGEQGVILPRDNIAHLMLKQEVVAAVNEGRFSIWPVAHITEAMELLTGMPAGRMRADSTFTPGTLYDKVDRRLAELGKLAKDAFKQKRKR